MPQLLDGQPRQPEQTETEPQVEEHRGASTDAVSFPPVLQRLLAAWDDADEETRLQFIRERPEVPRLCALSTTN